MYEGFQPGQDIPELPDYVASKETLSANPELAKKYPLNILAPKSHGFINSSYANMDHKLKAQGDQFVLINKIDAADRGVKTDDKVKVFNDRGSFEAVVKVTSDVNKGVVVTRGQTVKRGQLIGYTGNTGFSSLPHLHFGIYVAKFHGKYVSVPFSLDSALTKASP